MAEQSAKELFRLAVNAAHARDIPKARELIQASIRKDPTNPMAWLILASVAESKRNQLISLKKVLELDPTNKQAIKMVQGLGVDPDQLLGVEPAGRPPMPPATEAPPTTPAPPPEPAATPDPAPLALRSLAAEGAPVPIPTPEPRPKAFEDRVVLYATQARDLADEAMKIPPPPEGVRWVKKAENRAGENEILLVRAAAATAIITGVVAPLIIIGAVLWNIPQVRVLILRPTPTRFLSLQEPTTTPTPPPPSETPGFTPTPSPSPVAEAVGSVTPTAPPAYPFAAGVAYRYEPTEIFLPESGAGNLERGAARLIAVGNAAAAQQTLEPVRESLGEQEFNINLFFYEARSLIEQGEAEAALALLDMADERRERLEPTNTTYIAAIAAGRAEANLALGRAAVAAGSPGVAAGYFTQVQTQATEAIQNQPGWADPYLFLIERHILGQQYAQALDVIEDALAQPALAADLRFYILEAEVDYAQGRLDEAEQGAEAVLYGDPANARAHALRTQVAVDRENYALASLYVQAYLNFHPNTLDAWVTFGEVRLAEGNPLLALEAFTRAIEIGENVERLEVPVAAYLGRANIYEARGQYAQAFADVGRAAAATDDAELLAREMELAYRAGQYDRAQALLVTLRERGEIATGVANYMEARLILRAETVTEDDYQRVTSLIDGGIAGIPPQDQPAANALRARAYHALGNADAALNFIDTALQQEPRPLWFLQRADIYETQGDFQRAILEYERVLALVPLLPTSGTNGVDLITAANTGIERNEQNLLQAAATATAEAAG